jgi:hypothetical protein
MPLRHLHSQRMAAIQFQNGAVIQFQNGVTSMLNQAASLVLEDVFQSPMHQSKPSIFDLF